MDNILARSSEAGATGGSAPRITLVNALREAALSLGASPKRTLASAAIVMIGVAMSVGAWAVGESGRRDVLHEFDQMHSTEITLLERVPVTTANRDFPLDLDQRLRDLGPVASAGVLITTEPIDVAPRWNLHDSRTVTVYGADPATLEALDARTLPASNWQVDDCERKGLIGVEAAGRLNMGVTPADPGTIDVGGQPLAIVGSVLSAGLLPGLVDGIVVPECTVRRMGLTVVSRKAIVRVHRGAAESVARVAPLVARPWDPSGLVASYVPSPRRLRGAVGRSTQRTVQIVGLGVMALSALILSVTTGAAVSQRRTEIGLRRVFGAQPKDLYLQVMLESCIVGLFSGLVGTTLGMAGSVIAALVADWAAATPLYSWLVGPMAGAALGALSAVVPARRASKVEPRAAIES